MFYPFHQTSTVNCGTDTSFSVFLQISPRQIRIEMKKKIPTFWCHGKLLICLHVYSYQVLTFSFMAWSFISVSVCNCTRVFKLIIKVVADTDDWRRKTSYAYQIRFGVILCNNCKISVVSDLRIFQLL